MDADVDDSPRGAQQRRRRLGLPWRSRSRASAHLITDAAVGPGQDRRRREVEYAVLQLLRIPSMLAAAACLWLHWWVAAAVIAGITFPLPWVAVMLGNSKGTVKDRREKMTYRPGLARHIAQQQEAALEAASKTAPQVHSGSQIVEHVSTND